MSNINDTLPSYIDPVTNVIPDNWNLDYGNNKFILKNVTDYKSSRDNLNLLSSGNNDTPWYKNSDTMKGYTGLASVLLQAAALPSQLKYAKLQTKALNQSINQKTIDNKFKNTAISNLNTSLFPNKPSVTPVDRSTLAPKVNTGGI